MVLDTTLLLAGAIAYAVAIVTGAVAVLRRREPPHTLLFSVMALGLLLQTGGLYLRGHAQHSCPMGNPFEVLQFVSWSLVVIYMITGPVFRLTLFGPFSALIAAVLSLTAHLVPDWDVPPRAPIFGGNQWIQVHASLALFSYGVFGLLAASSIMFILQNYGLKQKRATGLFALLPSIVQLDHVNWRLLLIGSSVLSVSMVIGSIYWIQNLESASLFKLAATALVWIAYLVVLYLRFTNRLVGKRLAAACFFLFVLALLTLWPVEADRTTSETAAAATAPLISLVHASHG